MNKTNILIVILSILPFLVMAQEQDTVNSVSGDTMSVEKKQVPEEEPYMRLVRRLENKTGWINNRNSDNYRGIQGYIKGVYYGENKVFFLIVIQNKTNIEYEVESVNFISNPIKDGKRQLAPDEQVYVPIWHTEVNSIDRKETKKLIFVFNKFVPVENKNILLSMYELNGERNLVLTIKHEYFLKAEYLR